MEVSLLDTGDLNEGNANYFINSFNYYNLYLISK